MLNVFKYLKKKEKIFVFISIIFILLQVWLDLKLPDYMSKITTLVETKGSSIIDILTRGSYMVLCAILSMASSMIVGYFAAVVAAGLSKTLRGMVYDKTLSFSMEEINKFSTASLINRTTNDITQIQTLVAMGLQIIIKSPILAVWAVIKISGKSWQQTAATAVAVFILIIMLGIILIFAVPRFKMIQSLSDNLNRIVREHITGIRVVRAYNAEKYQENKFQKANNELTNTNLAAYRVINFKAKKGQIIALIGATGSGKSTLVNLVTRFYDVSKGEITIGGINIKEYKQEELHNKIGHHKRNQNPGMGAALPAYEKKANVKQAFSKLFSYSYLIMFKDLLWQQ